MVSQAQHIRGSVPVRSLAAMLEDPRSAACRALSKLYPDEAVLPDKARLCLGAARAFMGRFGEDASVLVARAPGRINLVGMHIDHRGGHVNPIAIKDVFFVFEPREDDEVHLCNVDDAAFPARSFTISEGLPRHKITDWDAWSQEEFEERKRRGEAADWSNYVKSAVLYLQHVHMRPDGAFEPPLRGMNMAVSGNVPMAAGLSSSSAIVVGAAEACIRVNAIAMGAPELVESCRLAEWYVGTRGGGGDHCAIKFGRKGHILHVAAFPVSVTAVPFPESHSIVLANSLVEAKKQEGARNVFNERVACYVFGLAMLRRNFPPHAPMMEYLRDVNPRTLGVSEAAIYRMIQSLPERCTRTEILDRLPDDRDLVEQTFRTHAEPSDGYRIRQVTAYGVTECVRSKMAGEILRKGDIESFGELMNISHEGDRVTRLLDGRRVPNDNALPDVELEGLIADAESGQPERVERSKLWRQPGGYDVSTEEQDTLVDIARGMPGVVGAGLVGAGLGGSIIAVVEREQAQAVIDAMAEHYYEPRGLPVAAEVVRPTEGSGILDIAGES